MEHGSDEQRGRVAGLLRLAIWLRPYRGHVAGAVSTLVLAAVGVLALGQALRVMVDRGLAAGQSNALDQYLAGMLVLALLVAAATAARFYLVSWLGERVAADLRRRVFGQVLGLDPAFYDTARVGELQSRITADTTIIEQVFGSSLSLALRNALLFVGSLALLLVTSPRLTALVLLGVPVVVIIVVGLGRRVRRRSRTSQDRVAAIGSHVDEALHGIRTVQAFNHEHVERQRFGERVEAAFRAAELRIRDRALLTGTAMLVVFCGVGVILWVGGHDVLAGRMSPGSLSAFVFYAALMAGSVAVISEVIGDLQRAAGAAERLDELLATRPRIRPPDAPRALPEPPRGRVALSDVHFGYPSRPDVTVLNGATLEAGDGETLALVGPSGAGKSTIFQLLLRFYDPDRGRVLVDDTDVRHVDPVALRERIGLVPQEPVIFAADARENIRYGRPDAGDAAIRSAASAARADELLDALPEGLDTFLGERGVQLSSGQKQRIAIARALLRDPAVLLLDEATSAVDAANELRIREALRTVMRGRTTVVIAHRLATVQSADRIAVLDQGRVQAVGRHDELVEASGLYARLAEAQLIRPDQAG